MKYILSISIFIFLIISSTHAQKEPTKHDLDPCGSIAKKSEWLDEFQKRPAHQKKVVVDSQIIYVPLSVHLLSRDNGFGGFPEEDALKALCTLNEDFEPANIVFYLENGFQYISDTDFFVHENVTDGGLKMLEYNIDNTFNCYIVSRAAGNCGYNLPYAGVANAINCMGPADHTWAHEMGHGFSLPHPFLGWEGGVSHDNSVPHNYNSPAPDSVYFDYSEFQDTLYLAEERIISVTEVEKMDGSNCLHAADGFCDTQPDYLSTRWSCNGDLISTVTQTDPNGEKFQSDATLIMSYALDNCSSRFSDDQIEAMRANIAEEFPLWLETVPAAAPIQNDLVYTSPINDDLVQFDEVKLEWESLGEETYYKVEVSPFQSFPFTDFKEVVNTNTVTLNNLAIDKTYYWRVLAYNASTFCVNYSETQSFETGDLVAVKELSELGEVSIYPNPLVKNKQIRIAWDTPIEEKMDIEIVDIHGRLVQRNLEYISKGSSHYDMKIDLPAGIYMVNLYASKGQKSIKIVVNK